MLIAASSTKDGRKLLVLGLQAENVERLLNDEPIYRSLAAIEGEASVPGLEDWDVTILGPEDTARVVAHVGASR
jgi:hypothetical protein